jgi:hypothetical protein
MSGDEWLDELVGDVASRIPGAGPLETLYQPDETKPANTDMLIHQTITPIQMQALAPYLATAQRLQDANMGTAPTMLSELSAGLIKVGTLVASARYMADKSRTNRKQVEGKLALEDFAQYCIDKQLKSTEALRTAFVESHPQSAAAAEQEAYYGALVAQLEIMKTTLVMAISSTRSIVYGYKDVNSVTGNNV